MTPVHRKASRTYDSDMAWAKRELKAGRLVWCVRAKISGIVVTLLSAGVERLRMWQSFDGQPLDGFTVSPIVLINDEPRLGPEQEWPKAVPIDMIEADKRLREAENIILDQHVLASPIDPTKWRN